MDLEEREKRFTRLWTKAVPVVSSYILSIVPNHSDRSDILQNTAIAALKKFDKYDEIRPFSKWVLGFAKYEILVAKRKYARDPIIFHDTLVETIMDLYSEMEEELNARSLALEKCLSQLPPKKMEVLKMRYEDTLPYDKIASSLKANPGTVRTQLGRIKILLKECIEKRIKSDSF